jgi:hypothetical protein
VSLKVITAMYGSHRQVGALLPQRTAGMVGSGTRRRQPATVDQCC